ncbi:hypothetical protein DXF93_23595 [Escherichia coli]|nr:hypothetical protein DXF93_23595 [Escherichia coli]
MRHYTRHFAGTTPYTLLAVSHNKTIHSDLLFWFNKPYFLYDQCIYLGYSMQAMYICPEALLNCHGHVADQFIVVKIKISLI